MQKLPKLCRQKSKAGDRAYVKIQGKKYYCGDWGNYRIMEQTSININWLDWK